MDRLITALTERTLVCGSTKIVAIDGRSGVGKTQFATELAQTLGCPMVSLEWVYPGWHGLQAGIDAARGTLSTLATDQPAQLSQWDWYADQPAPPITLEPAPVLILEGVGAGAAVLRPFISFLIWLDAPTEVRHDRAMAREGETYRDWWEIWAEQEEKYLAENRPMDHADLFLPTTPAQD